jgi:hypothetical protein
MCAGTSLFEVAAQSTTTITAPAAAPRIDRVVIDWETGAVMVVEGAEAVVPTAPDIPAGKLPIARIALAVGTAAITNSMISDERVSLSVPATGGLAVRVGGAVTVPTATQAEAEAGTAANKAMTPQRTAQAIAALTKTASSRNRLKGASALKNPWRRGLNIRVSGSVLATLSGTPFGNMINGVALTAAFDGAVTKSYSACVAIGSGSAYVGRPGSSATTLNKVTIYSSSDRGFCFSNSQITINVYGKNSAPSSATDGTIVGSATVTDGGSSQVVASVAFVQASYLYWWIGFVCPGTQSGWVSQVQFFGPTPSQAYTADRWVAWRSAASELTVSRQASGISAAPYCFRVQRPSGDTALGTIGYMQVIESIDVIEDRGKKLTVSIPYRKGGDFSGGTITASLVCGTGPDEGAAALIAGMWTGASSTAVVLTPLSTWQTDLTLTITVPAAAAELALKLTWTPSGTAGASDYLEFGDMKLDDAGATSSDVNSISDVLRECERFFLVRTTAQQVSDLAYQMRTTPTQKGSGPYYYDAELN